MSKLKEIEKLIFKYGVSFEEALIMNQIKGGSPTPPVEKKYYHVGNSTQAYYDLGERFNGQNGKYIEIDLLLKDGTLGLTGLFGSRETPGNANSYNSFMLRFDTNGPGPTVPIDKFPRNKKFTIKFKELSMYIDNVAVITNANYPTEYDGNAFLFSINTGGLPMTPYFVSDIIEMYDTRIYSDEGVLLNNYEPQADGSRKCSVTGVTLQLLGTGSFDVVEIKESNWENYGELAAYVRSTAGAYIDTGYVFKTNNQKKILTMSNPVDSSALQVVNGSQSSGSARSPYIGYSNGKVKIGFGSQSAGTSPITFDLKLAKTTYTLETKDDNTYKFEDSTGKVYEGSWAGNLISGRSDYLFRLNYTSGVFPSLSNSYNYVGYDDNVKAFDLTPLYINKKAVTDTAGRVHEVGSYVMWDLVTNTVPSHIGDFTGARKIYPNWVYEMGTPIPAIRTTGSSWFTTNFELGYTGKTVIKTIAENTVSTKGLYGWYNSADNSRVAIGIASGKWFAGKDNTNYGPTTVVGEPVTITMDRDNNRFSVNEANISLTPVSSDVKHKAFLGHRSNTAGGVFSSSYVGIIQLWQEYATDGTILKDSTPLIHNDGTVGIVDLITREFEGSATITPFEAITDESVVATLSELGINPTGNTEENIKTLNEMGVKL